VLRDQLQGNLEHLTEEQRQVVVLRFVDGLSSQEVSHLLNKLEGGYKGIAPTDPLWVSDMRYEEAFPGHSLMQA